jgi:hypothetical protein
VESAVALSGGNPMDEPQPPAPSLGARVELITVSRLNVYVGFVLGTIMTLGGLGMTGCGMVQLPGVFNPPNQKARQDAAGRLFGGVCVGGLFILFGVLGIAVSRSLRGTGVEVCENGFREWPPSPTSRAALWGDVARIEERHVRDKVPLKLGGPLLNQPRREFVAVCRDGSQVHFGLDYRTRLGRIVKHLRAAAEKHTIPWVVVRGG